MTTFLAPVVQRLESAIHWINRYPLDNSVGFGSTYPLDSMLHVLQVSRCTYILLTHLSLAKSRDTSQFNLVTTGALPFVFDADLVQAPVNFVFTVKSLAIG